MIIKGLNIYTIKKKILMLRKIMYNRYGDINEKTIEIFMFDFNRKYDEWLYA